MPKSSVKRSTVLPEISSAALTTGALIDQWAQSMMLLKAISTSKPSPISCWILLPTASGPPAWAPLAMATLEALSMTMTFSPASTASMPAHRPAAPAPAMTTSHSSSCDAPEGAASASSTTSGAASVSAVSSVSAARATPAASVAPATAAPATKPLRVMVFSIVQTPFVACLSLLVPRAAVCVRTWSAVWRTAAGR